MGRSMGKNAASQLRQTHKRHSLFNSKGEANEQKNLVTTATSSVSRLLVRPYF